MVAIAHRHLTLVARFNDEETTGNERGHAHADRTGAGCTCIRTPASATDKEPSLVSLLGRRVRDPPPRSALRASPVKGALRRSGEEGGDGHRNPLYAESAESPSAKWGFLHTFLSVSFLHHRHVAPTKLHLIIRAIHADCKRLSVLNQMPGTRGGDPPQP